MTIAEAVTWYIIGIVIITVCALIVWASDRDWTAWPAQRRWAARIALASPLWPVLLPIAMLYGIAQIGRALWRDAWGKKP